MRQVLDAMGAAAELMSTPPRLLEQGPAADPRLKPHLRIKAAKEAAEEEQRRVQTSEGGTSVAGRTAADADAGQAATSAEGGGKSRVWGHRSIAKRAAGTRRTHRNRCVRSTSTSNTCL